MSKSLANGAMWRVDLTTRIQNCIKPRHSHTWTVVLVYLPHSSGCNVESRLVAQGCICSFCFSLKILRKLRDFPPQDTEKAQKFLKILRKLRDFLLKILRRLRDFPPQDTEKAQRFSSSPSPTSEIPETTLLGTFSLSTTLLNSLLM